MTPIGDLPAIDVHAHYGAFDQAGAEPLERRCRSGDGRAVAALARAANTVLTVVSPLRGLMPRKAADVTAANEEAARHVEQIEGLLQWVIVDPLALQTLDQARQLLGRPKCMGIKIHPKQHGYSIDEQGRTIFQLAAATGAVILSHSGDAGCRPMDFVPLADEFPEVKLILAHLGYDGAGHRSLDLHVRAMQACRHGNLLADTSSAQSLTPGLIEWAAHEVGADRLLYGTDSPLYFAPSQRARIDRAGLSDAEKRMILCENARRALPIPDEIAESGGDSPAGPMEG